MIGQKEPRMDTDEHGYLGNIEISARLHFAALTRAFAGGFITNRRYEEQIDAMRRSKVRCIHAIYVETWFWYCDLSVHRLVGPYRLDATQRGMAARCILFLRSGEIYRWPAGLRRRRLLKWITLGIAARPYDRLRDAAARGDREVWPFFDRGQHDRARRRPTYLAGASD
jgi:hypothetical protein